MTSNATERYLSHEHLARLALQPERPRPRLLTRAQLRALSDRELDAYQAERAKWHNNVPVLRTAPMTEMQDTLDDLVESQRWMEEGDRHGLWIDAESSMGKSTGIRDWGKRFYLRRRLEHLNQTGSEFHGGTNKYVPLAYITLSERPTPRSINDELSRFYGQLEAAKGANSATLANRAVDLMYSCGTEVLVFDDAHAMANRYANTDKTSKHLKFLMSKAPVTIVLASANAHERDQLINDNLDVLFDATQIAHRFVPFELRKFERNTREWTKVIGSAATRLVLTDFDRDSFVRQQDRLFEMTGGFMGTLWVMLRSACHRAIITGVEDVTEAILDRAHRDWAAKERQRLLQDQRTRKGAGLK